MLLSKCPERASARQFVAVSCMVPGDAKAGVYASTFQVRINGEKVCEIPVKLEVYGFVLPARSALKTAFSLKASHIGVKFKDRESINRIYGKMLDLCEYARHDPRLARVEPKFSFRDGVLSTDWEQYEAELKKYFERFSLAQITSAQLGSHALFYRWNTLLGKKYASTSDPEFQSLWGQFIRQFNERFTRNGMMKNMLFIIWDEPYRDSFENPSGGEDCQKKCSGTSNRNFY